MFQLCICLRKMIGMKLFVFLMRIMDGFDCRQYLCPVAILLWCALVGPLIILLHMFCCHYPSAEKRIQKALEKLRAKGIDVKFEVNKKAL